MQATSKFGKAVANLPKGPLLAPLLTLYWKHKVLASNLWVVAIPFGWCIYNQNKQRKSK